MTKNVGLMDMLDAIFGSNPVNTRQETLLTYDAAVRCFGKLMTLDLDVIKSFRNDFKIPNGLTDDQANVVKTILVDQEKLFVEFHHRINKMARKHTEMQVGVIPDGELEKIMTALKTGNDYVPPASSERQSPDPMDVVRRLGYAGNAKYVFSDGRMLKSADVTSAFERAVAGRPTCDDCGGYHK